MSSFLWIIFNLWTNPPLMDGGLRLDLFCINPEKDQKEKEFDCLIRLYWLLKVVFCFALQHLFLCAGDFSLPVCLFLSLTAHRSGLFLFRQVNALDCALYLVVQPRPHWLGSQILSALIAGSRCHSGPLLFRWPTGCTFSWRLLSICSCNLACCRPRLADRHCFLVIKRSPETHPIKALLCRFKWCWHCVGLHRLFWLSGLLSASLCGNILALNDESKDE